MHIPTPIRSLALVGAVSAVHSVAHAEIAFTNYVDANTFAYVVLDMPDVDQQRTDLPNNGACYCGPSANFDVLGYVSAHGFPHLGPGIPAGSTWADASNYASIGATLCTYGNAVSCSSGSTATASCGDSGSACGSSYASLYTHLTAQLGDEFVVRQYYRSYSRGYFPSTYEFACAGANNDAIGLLLLGRHTGSWSGTTFNQTGRTSGHFQVITTAIAGGGFKRLGVRDPISGSSDPRTSQSAAATSWWNVTSINFVSSSGSGAAEQLSAPSASAALTLLEGIIAVWPAACYTWDAESSTAARITPSAATWRPGREVLTNVPLETGTPLLRVLPDDIRVASLANGSVRLRNRFTGAGVTAFTPPAGNTVRGFDVDRLRYLHVALGSGHAARVDLDQLGAQPVITPLASVPTSVSVAGDIAHYLMPANRMIAAVNYAPQGSSVVPLPIPGNATINSTTRLTVAHGFAFLLTAGNVSAYRFTPKGLIEAALNFPAGILDLADGDRGTICTVGADRVTTAWKISPKGLVLNAAHPMHGLQVKSRLLLSRSSTGLAVGEDFLVDADQTLEPADVPTPDCRTDLNVDGRTDAADLAIVLSEWDLSRSIADVDRDGTVGAADLAAVLSAFGACP